MSLLSWIQSKFQPPQSQLSNPRVQLLEPQHIRILKELDGLGKITANRFNKLSKENSADKRINDLYHMGFVSAEKHQNYFLYWINDKGLNIIK